jgi:group I intron endonuclease
MQERERSVSPSFAENERVMARIRADESAHLTNFDKSFSARQGSVYKIVNQVNGKAYIGQTMRRVEDRMNNHKNPRHKNRVISRAILKYGWHNFTWGVLERAEAGPDLDAMEARMIAEHQTLTPHGYNVLSGAAKAMTEADRKALGRLISKARNGKTKEERDAWRDNVRAAQTTTAMLKQRSESQKRARASKTQEELAEWNRKSAENMKAKASKYVEDKLATMGKEEGKKWLRRLEATKKWRRAKRRAKRRTASSISHPLRTAQVDIRVSFNIKTSV